MNPGLVISKAQISDWEPAMELCWRTFLKYEACDYSKEGVENFLLFISGQQLFKMFEAGEYQMWVCKENDRIVGVGTLRANSHISLLFVDSDYHRQGIGKALITTMQEDRLRFGEVKLTVNASPYGVPFYTKVGFEKADDMKSTDGILYTPMILLRRV